MQRLETLLPKRTSRVFLASRQSAVLWSHFIEQGLFCFLFFLSFFFFGSRFWGGGLGLGGGWIGGVNSCDESRVSARVTMQHSYLHSPIEAAAVPYS